MYSIDTQIISKAAHKINLLVNFVWLETQCTVQTHKIYQRHHTKQTYKLILVGWKHNVQYRHTNYIKVSTQNKLIS